MSVDLKAAYRKLHDWFKKSGLERVKNPEELDELEDGKLCRVCLLGAVYAWLKDGASSFDECGVIMNDICDRLRARGDSPTQLRTVPDREARLKFFVEGASE